MPNSYCTLISAIMADITAIGKDKRNAQQGFNFCGIDDVMNVMKPILSRHQVFTVPEVLEQVREVKASAKGGERRYSLLRVRFRFYAPDGSYVDAVTQGEGMDSGNKAMAIAYKYALFQVFCIPTEEMIDPDAESHETLAKPAALPDGRTISPEQQRKAYALLQEIAQWSGDYLERVKASTKHDFMRDHLQGLCRELFSLPSCDMTTAREYIDYLTELVFFFGTLKSECLYRARYSTRAEVEELIAQYIHFYNFERIHLKNGLTSYKMRSKAV